MSSAKRASRRHGPRGAQDVVIGYCRPATVDGHFFDAVTNLFLHDREHNTRIAATIGVESGPRIATARCQVVRKFLELTDAEWFNWFDTDMIPTPTYLDELLAVADPVERPIVGGLCFAGGRTKIVPTIYVIAHDEDNKLKSDTMLTYPPNTVIEVGGTGSACLLIHRTVFEKVAELMGPDHPLPWYQDVIVDNKDWGEDLIFCLRARAAGARIWVHTGVKVGHRKTWTIDEAAFLAYAKKLDETLGDDNEQVLTHENLPNIEILPDLELVP